MGDSAFDKDAVAGRGTKGLNGRSLETRIPPPVVAALTSAAMWGVSQVTPMIQVPVASRTVAALVIAAVGGMVAMGAGVRFRRAKTTVNPLQPQTASSLVTAGIYGYTRNPMYLGLLFLLVAWAVFLSSPVALLGPVAFVSYIGRFQIAPEERALSGLFGAEYTAYRSRARRWL